ncbi:hypothetical protein NXS19_001134 [Fusarium pseudograminearum]|nr:hypothetical protein NXS19_001134 [Fusarium pseudograminearum]
MAFWVVDGGRPLGLGTTTTSAAAAINTSRGPYYVGGKRRVSISEGGDAYSYSHAPGHGDAFNFDPKRSRLADELPYDAYDNTPMTIPGPSGYSSPQPHDHFSPYYQQPQQQAFQPRIHHGNKSAHPYNHPCNSLTEDEFLYHDDIGSSTPPLIHRPDSAPVKNLSFLVIRERSPTPEGFPSIDASFDLGAFGPAPESRPAPIFSAANELFFGNRLAGRVAWDWSHPASAQYQAHIVGTTAVRRSRDGGYETLIVLSSPILQDTKYNRRLLISTFLHEMIHSYLFVVCGLKARYEGGHTEGFRQIADTIDRWVGHSYLRLSEMDADLEHFRQHPACGHDQHQVRSRSADGQERIPWRSERWEDGERERERSVIYPTELHPRPHPSYENRDRHGREGHRALHVRRGISPYVY